MITRYQQGEFFCNFDAVLRFNGLRLADLRAGEFMRSAHSFNIAQGEEFFVGMNKVT